MPRSILFEGRTVTVPDDATDVEVAEILGGELEVSPVQPMASHAPTAPDIRDPDDPNYSLADYGKTFIRGLKSRASGLASLPKALVTDPAGVAGGLAKGLTEIPGRLVEDVTDFKRINRTDPLRLIEDATLVPGIVAGATRLLGKGAEQAGSRLANSALKPSAALRGKNIGQDLGATMAQEGYTVSQRSAGKLRTRLDALQRDAEGLVANQAEKTIPKAALMQSATQLVDEMMNPSAKRPAARELAGLAQSLPDEVPVGTVSTLLNQLSDTSKPAIGAARTAAQSVQNAIRGAGSSALKGTVEGLRTVKGEQSRLIPVHKALQQRLEALRTQDPISRSSLPMALAGGAGYALGLNPTAAAVGGALVASPYVRSLAAIPLTRAGRAMGGRPMGAVDPYRAAIQAELAAQMASQEPE